jgi:prepilin-type N-terminal cleavage/methylation domain-containing protein
MQARRVVIEGFTLVEIMIVVMIIGVLTALAAPSFLKARSASKASVCLSNLRLIDGAKEMYEFETDAGEGDPCRWDNILPYIRRQPVCPSGGEYVLGNLGALAVCTQHDFSNP